MQLPVSTTAQTAIERIRSALENHNISPLDIVARAYPDEVNFIVYVREEVLPQAISVGNQLDDVIGSPDQPAFVVVRKAPPSMVASADVQPLKTGVQDDRATRLVQLITARSRVSEVQPSLSYIRDVRSNLSAVTVGRHHLIFGRRGAGKSALLVEAKRQIDAEGNISCWINMQTYRSEDPAGVFLNCLDAILGTIVAQQHLQRPGAVLSATAARLYEHVQSVLLTGSFSLSAAERLIPQVQKLLRRFLDQDDRQLFIFIDDFYFIRRDSQPQILDMLASAIRDCNAWLKIASIRHLTRWFQNSPPLGLQTTQDAELIDLDVTLQDPKRAKSFLESILTEYCKAVGIGSLARIFNGKALDRLVLASGAVPRDYLVLASSSVQSAQKREKARLVGAQDVNQVAGDAMQVKLQELEEDMAANVEWANRTIQALSILRGFLEDTNYTYFLVDYRDKENRPHEYNLLTDLLSVRIVHLVDAGVSHAHAAGQRSEAFMLDLSQYSGLRYKQDIEILDFEGGRIVAKRTRSSKVARVGDTPRQVISILRVAPTFELERFVNLNATATRG